MRSRAIILLLASLAPLCGQEKGHAVDPNDIRTFLIESQIVEYRPKLGRDPFQATQEDRSREQRGDMLINEITIIGRIVVNKKPYLIILDSKQDAKSLPIGYRFQDGEITAITESGAVFTTWNPALGPTRSPIKRTVTKPFKREEGK